MIERFNANGLSEIVCDDGFVISSPTEHCAYHWRDVNWIIYGKFGHDNLYVAHDLNTHTEVATRVNSGIGSCFKAISDSTHIAVALHGLQEKSFGRTDLIVIGFNKTARAWISWTQNNFYKIGGGGESGYRPNTLWIKHGSAPAEAPPLDPGTLYDYDWNGINEIRWECPDIGQSFKRAINIATGELGPVQNA